MAGILKVKASVAADEWELTRKAYERLGDHIISEGGAVYAGIPMAVEKTALVINKRYPTADLIQMVQDEREAKADALRPYEPELQVRACWWSHQPKLRDVQYVLGWKRIKLPNGDDDAELTWGTLRNEHPLILALETMSLAKVWGYEQETKAMELLVDETTEVQMRQYLMTGCFLETSPRSNLTYVFRRCRPTLALSGSTGELRVLAALCLHPIAYYASTFAGGLCPTDDVIAHLTLMRGDEHGFWKKANQHHPAASTAGLMA